MSNLMSIEEFNNSLKQLFDEQCNTVKNSTAGYAYSAVQNFFANNAVLGYLQSQDGYTDWRMLPSQSVYNIGLYFGQHPEYGEKLGFIDGGLIFKKGKIGTLFFQGGLSVRGSSDNMDTSISYEDLCRAIIRNSNNNPALSDCKFIISFDGNTIIEAKGKMLDRLLNIRGALLATHESAQAAYDNQYRNLIDNLSYNVSSGNFDQARRLAPLLCEFASGNPQNVYPVPQQLNIILLMMQHLFDDAIEFAKNVGSVEWVNISSEKKDEYQQILSRNYYDSASSHYKAGEISESLTDVKKSIDTWQTEDGWRLYLNIVSEYACKENMYMNKDIQRIIGGDISSVQRAVLSQENQKVNDLTQKYDEFIKQRRSLMIDKIKSEDISFFRENKYGINTYQDIYGMTPLGYAALYNKINMLPELMKLIPNNTARNVIGHDLLDICAFSARSIYDYDNFAGRFDQIYQNTKRAVQNNMPYRNNAYPQQPYGAPPQQYYNGRPAQQPYGGVQNHPYNNGYYPHNQPYAQNNGSAFASDPRLLNYYNERVHNAWTPVLDYYRSGLKSMPELLDSSATVNDYMNHPTYSDVFAQRKELFINDYVRRKSGPKGEFETTDQYEERQASVRIEAESEFEVKASEVMHSYEKELIEKNRVHNLCAELAKIYIDCLFSGNASLGTYDADKQQFTLSWNECSSSVNIPLSAAPDFKRSFTDSGAPFKVINVSIDDSRNITAECAVYFAEKSYPVTFIKKV